MSNITPHKITQENLQTLERAGVIPKGCPPAQVSVFAEVARRHGLDPFTKEVHLVGYGGSYSVIVGINGLRGRASDTGLHAGTDDPKFNMQPDGQYHTLSILAKSGKMPDTCTVTVYKMIAGQRVPFTATVAFKEFSTGRNKWASMPYQMIGKVAESHALRKAFPRQVSGLYLDEEMQQAAKARTVDVEHKELPTLNQDHPQWQAAVKAVYNGATRQRAEINFTITDEVWKALVDAATALDLQQE